MLKKRRMYPKTKTYNPAVEDSNDEFSAKGCHFDCSYCVFKKIVATFAKMSSNPCQSCILYLAHEHPERIKIIPSAENVFVFGNGDITFYRPSFVRRVITRIKEHLKRCPHKQFFFQSKNPFCFNQYLEDLEPIADNVILLTTLETNRDEGYSKISKAPPPSERFSEFVCLGWKRKRVTIEPILKFDHFTFLEWIEEIGPELVYIGYNSRPKLVQLPEPEPADFYIFYEALQEITEVVLKNEDILKKKWEGE